MNPLDGVGSFQVARHDAPSHGLFYIRFSHHEQAIEYVARNELIQLREAIGRALEEKNMGESVFVVLMEGRSYGHAIEVFETRDAAIARARKHVLADRFASEWEEAFLPPEGTEFFARCEDNGSVTVYRKAVK
jgi:hypothetical protein